MALQGLPLAQEKAKKGKVELVHLSLASFPLPDQANGHLARDREKENKK